MHRRDRAKEQAQIPGLVIPEGEGRFPEFTRAEGERRLKALCKAAGLPTPSTNARVAGHEVDAVRRAQRLVAEVDGWRYHGTWSASERDRGKDAALQVAGYRVVRITYNRLRNEPIALSAQLGALLSVRPD